jgi:hypothetical protein
MPALLGTMDQTDLQDTEGPRELLAEYQLETSAGKPGEDEASWAVALFTDRSQIWRYIRIGHEKWNADREQWQPEGMIWPTWPARPADEGLSSESALSGVQDYWAETGNRLRDSAKWMATVIGAALAALIGTSPLALIKGHHFGAVSLILGAIGLLSLGTTLFLIMQVMRPKALSFTDIQSARLRPFPGALGRWQDRVESHHDMYLPCGVRCLTTLRQSMIIEKITLIALAMAHEKPVGRTMCHELREAQAARAARLVELRNAAVRITTIGEYYALRSRSTWATYGGILCGLIGTAATIAAFTWPPA